ncbi:tyrosine-type recombinase/integrase [Haloarcula pelagica]|uniref:tyrosine-type recombinase/integrase n=2 Tax=Haloarcula TaxID=2237 RepID=UPI0024C313B3|nr:tyrosine-type recombinase/integrase [Halomicroarcula sp. YJ-61-S]
MVNVNEPTRLQQKLDRRWEQLDAADIDDRDREAIRAFVEYRRDVEDRARSTLTNDLSQLRCASERAETWLVDMSFGDLRRLLSTLVTPKPDGYGLDPDGTGMYGYKRALRVFFRFLDESDDWGDYPWHEDVELPTLEMSGAGSREEMLSGEDIEALKDAATCPRDRALIALLADIGGRIGMVLSLRRKDMHLDGDEPYFEPNAEVVDGLKDLDSTQIPVLYSRAEVRTYLRHHHPDKGNPSAPVWALERGYDHDNPQQSAVGDDRVRDVLQGCADRAGIAKPVNPHNFRRTGATRMSNSDRLTPQEIIQILGWSDDRPLEAYDQTTESERNSAIHEALGFSQGNGGSDEDELAFEHIVCGNCREEIESTAQFCPNCGHETDDAARQLKEDAKDDVSGDAINEPDSDRRELKGVVREVLAENPSLLED